MERLKKDFFDNPAPEVAKNLIGKILCSKHDGVVKKSMIVETEAYLGEDDSASHARFGPNKNGKVMWDEAGTIGIYLCYGLHYMFNITTGKKGDPQAVLVRGVKDAVGPGKLTKFFGIDLRQNGQNVASSDEVWLEEGPPQPCTKEKRVGIDFAKEKDKNRKLRFLIKSKNNLMSFKN